MSLGAFLDAHGLDPSAVEGGRVFVDGRRATQVERVLRAGARVRVHDATPSPPEADIRILYEDEALLVVDKPAGVAVNVSETSARRALVERFADRSAIAVHRLDLGTTGVLLFAKTSRAAAALSRAFAERSVGKRYLAVVEGSEALDTVLSDPIGKDRRRPRARAVHPAGQAAETAVKVLGSTLEAAVIEARPRTGRTHQIRVHLSHAGRPLLGDTLYGGPAAVRLAGEIRRLPRPLLHARALTLPKALGGHEFQAPMPEDMQAFLKAAGVDDPE
ncbi:MAG: RluA family pseudouridine synthase [Myxococcota bacterium]